GRTGAADAVSRAAQLTPEAADRISAIVGEGTLAEAMADGKRAMKIAREMIDSGAWSKQDQAAFVQGGEITKAGKLAVEQTLLGGIVGDVGVLEETPASVRQILIRAAGPLMQIRAAARNTDLDFDSVLADALEVQGLRKSMNAK